MPSALEQWAFGLQWVNDSEYGYRCPSCHSDKNEGHAKDCGLATELERAGFPVEWYIGPMHGPWPARKGWLSDGVIAALMSYYSGMPMVAAKGEALTELGQLTPTRIGLDAVVTDRLYGNQLASPRGSTPEQRGEER